MFFNQKWPSVIFRNIKVQKGSQNQCLVWFIIAFQWFPMIFNYFFHWISRKLTAGYSVIRLSISQFNSIQLLFMVRCAAAINHFAICAGRMFYLLPVFWIRAGWEHSWNMEHYLAVVKRCIQWLFSIWPTQIQSTSEPIKIIY